MHCENVEGLGGWVCLIISAIAFELTEVFIIRIILMNLVNAYHARMDGWMDGLANRFGWLEFHTELCFTLLFLHHNLPQTLWI